MKEPRVSIITVVLNGEKHIEQAIQSVLSQSHINTEYIVIDGGSTDGTLKIIEKYKTQINSVISEPDKGMYYAVNKGIHLCTGDLIGILNCDDWYETNTIELVVDAYIKNPESAVFHGILKYWNEHNKPVSVGGHHSGFLPYGMIEHPTCFVKREIYNSLGLFDTEYLIAADYDFMLRIYRNQKEFIFIDHLLTNFRWGGISYSFKAAIETISIQRKYHLISFFKKFMVLSYWWYIYYIKPKL